jgi:hypothetical protein
MQLAPIFGIGRITDEVAFEYASLECAAQPVKVVDGARFVVH